MTALPGEPDLLEYRADELTRSALAIADVIEQLQHMALEENRSLSVATAAARGARVVEELQRIHERYAGTAMAISRYSASLTIAHLHADRALEDRDVAQARADNAELEVDYWRQRLADPDLDQQSEEYRRRRANWDDALDEAAGHLRIAQAAQGVIDDQRRSLEDAADAAIAQIRDAIADTNENVLDRIGHALGTAGEWLDLLGRSLLDAFHQVRDTVLALAGAALLLIAVAMFGPPLGTARAIALLMYLRDTIAEEAGKPTPEVGPLSPPDKPRYLTAEDFSLETVLAGTGEVDRLGDAPGGGDPSQTVVRITKVPGADGRWHWTVTLPSTQEWFTAALGGDDGAVNDLDSNLTLMLTPIVQTQYERAVLEAMSRAGIDPADPVMLVGFSQGGILAGDMAAYGSGYNVEAIVVSGAPIDDMPIPDDVAVVSVQHTDDAVPSLDTLLASGGLPRHGPNWTTIVGSGGHSADEYAGTLAGQVDDVRAAHPELDDFFPKPGDADGLPATNTYYAFHE